MAAGQDHKKKPVTQILSSNQIQLPVTSSASFKSPTKPSGQPQPTTTHKQPTQHLPSQQSKTQSTQPPHLVPAHSPKTQVTSPQIQSNPIPQQLNRSAAQIISSPSSSSPNQSRPVTSTHIAPSKVSSVITSNPSNTPSIPSTNTVSTTSYVPPSACSPLNIAPAPVPQRLPQLPPRVQSQGSVSGRGPPPAIPPRANVAPPPTRSASVQHQQSPLPTAASVPPVTTADIIGQRVLVRQASSNSIPPQYTPQAPPKFVIPQRQNSRTSLGLAGRSNTIAGNGAANSAAVTGSGMGGGGIGGNFSSGNRHGNGGPSATGHSTTTSSSTSPSSPSQSLGGRR